MAFAKTLDGEQIFYRTAGTSGPNVVLIQGLGLSSRFWFDMPERLANDGYRAIALDNRGVGRSARPRGPYRVATMADDVIEVMDAAGADDAYVVGISMGGMIAQEVALRHPARVRGLVLLATTAGLPHGRLPAPSALRALLGVGTRRQKHPGVALAKLLLPDSQIAHAAELMSEWPAAMREDAPSALAFLAQLAGAVTHSTGFRLKKIHCPVAIVTGEEDVLIPAKNSRILKRAIPHAHLEIIPDCAHGIPITDEAVVARALANVGARPHPSASFASSDRERAGLQ